MNMLSKKAQNLKPSPTLFLVAKAKELAAQGHDVISLTVGEPDWSTFEIPSMAGIEAIQKNITKYTAAAGTVELRKVITERTKIDIGLDYTPAQVTVGSGAKFIIFAALQMLCDPGDEVIIHSPYWVSYPTMVELADGVPNIVVCDESDNFKLSAERLEKAITKKTKAFLFCSPSNPTGLFYSKEELTAIAAVLKRHPHVFVISDDIYNRLTFDGSSVAPHLLHVAPELKERVIIVNGGSKAYSMTGWRIGWAVGPQKIIASMADYQSQTTGSASSIAQHALQKAIPSCENDIKQVNQTLIQRKMKAMAALSTIKEFKVTEPQGAFYLWVNIKQCLGRKFESMTIENDKMFCDILLQKYFVATVPGIECGNSGYLRLSFAISTDKFIAAVERMKTFVAALS
ncbi:MAG: pyridoxal phosphate-dependent aminotransferase [Bdellovibrionaceae bacterium]|nr:pyridoxal phosphate-dependent aminotransferase [Pseudobdellovibrionaceae bacterium]